jgi:hypothetical protein
LAQRPALHHPGQGALRALLRVGARHALRFLQKGDVLLGIASVYSSWKLPDFDGRRGADSGAPGWIAGATIFST